MSEGAKAYAEIIKDELVSQGFECSLYRGIVPFIPNESLKNAEDCKRALEAVKALGHGCDIFSEGLFVRP